jgi:hypothetical protein
MEKQIRSRRIPYLLVLFCFVTAPSLYAQQPFLKRLLQRRDWSAQDLTLQDSHGPWLILAGSFIGSNAQASATALARELQAALGVPAFIMEKSTDEADQLAVTERIHTDDYGKLIPKQLSIKYANDQEQRSVAVLVGEFHSKEDPQIEQVLTKVRAFQPKSKIEGFDQRGIAFLTRNPKLPDDFFQAPKVDSFVQELNRQQWIEYSLLDCPGRFTVRVASFRGPEVVTVAAKAKSSDPGTALDRAANKAHKMTQSLRSKGVEAYEFHDRYGSYVMIGSFDSLGREISGGQFEYDPGITAILNRFCGYREVTAKDPTTGAVSRTVSLNSEARLPFDIEGKPLAVPRTTTSKIYGGSLFK